MQIPPSRQCLVFEGRQLEDDRTLEDLVVKADASLTHQNVKIHSTDSSHDGRGGICVAFDDQTGLWKVNLDPDRVNRSCEAAFASAHLKVLAGSPRYPLLLFEDFEGHANPHDVKVLISPTKLMKFGHHDMHEGESASRPKTRVFSLQVECGTYTLWYSRPPREASSFFSGQKPSEGAKELHHTMPLLGVVDLHNASMYATDVRNSEDGVHTILTIILTRKENQLPELSDKYFYCIKKWAALRIVCRSQHELTYWIKQLQSCNVLLGTCQDDQLFKDARVIDLNLEQAFKTLADLNAIPDAAQSESSLVMSLLSKRYKEALEFFTEADAAYESLNCEARHPLAILGKSIDSTRHSRRNISVTETSPHTPTAGIHKHNIAAFCIATLFNADLEQKLLLHSTHALISAITDASKNPVCITSEEASRLYEEMKTKMYQKAIANALERGKPRDTALEERDASVMQQFCIAQESGTPEYASLVSHTLICLCTYLNQRSIDETSLHPHYNGVPHRHCQLFNRTWCRLAELRFEFPVLRFALLQVID